MDQLKSLYQKFLKKHEGYNRFINFFWYNQSNDFLNSIEDSAKLITDKKDRSDFVKYYFDIIDFEGSYYVNIEDNGFDYDFEADDLKKVPNKIVLENISDDYSDITSDYIAYKNLLYLGENVPYWTSDLEQYIISDRNETVEIIETLQQIVKELTTTKAQPVDPPPTKQTNKSKKGMQIKLLEGVEKQDLIKIYQSMNDCKMIEKIKAIQFAEYHIDFTNKQYTSAYEKRTNTRADMIADFIISLIENSYSKSNVTTEVKKNAYNSISYAIEKIK